MTAIGGEAMKILEEIVQELDKGAPWILYRQDLATILRRVAAHHQQPAPVVDDARMARALEWVRGERRPGGEMVVPDRSILAAIEESIAAYDPNCGARAVRGLDDAMVRELIEAAHAVWYDTLGATTGGKSERLRAALARAQGVQRAGEQECERNCDAGAQSA